MSAEASPAQPELRLAGSRTPAVGTSIGDEHLGCLIALAGLPGFGPATLLRVALDGHPVEVWSQVCAGGAHRVPMLAAAFERDRWTDPVGKSAALARAAVGVRPSGELERHCAEGRQVCVFGGPGYPERLAEDPAPPAVLFLEGRREALDGPTVAMVGTRNATRAGRELASDLAASLARAGVAVVSGLALGIDGAAHAGALAVAAPPDPPAGDPPIARPIGVVASGLDIAYPRRHQQLHRDIVRHGLLVSETPLGRRPTAWRFPARNRIIAGLADAAVIVESRSAGGSMLTAAEALRRDRPVLAVPGHPTAPAAAGANDLIFDGAVPVRDVEDILVAIGRGGTSVAVGPRPDVGGPAADSGEGHDILVALGTEPLSLDEVVDRAGVPLEVAAATLVRLEAQGAVLRSGTWFERTGHTASAGGPRQGRAR